MSEPGAQQEPEQNPFASPHAAGAVPPLLPPVSPGAYQQVPFYRRNSFCSNMTLAHLVVILLGACGLRPLLLLTPATALGVIVVCIIVLTGPVYFNKVGKDGQLKQWSVANKVAAVILLALFVVGPAVMVVLYFAAVVGKM